MTAGRTLFPLPIEWIAAQAQIGSSKGAKSVLHRWVHGQNKTTAAQAKACAQLEFESTVDPFPAGSTSMVRPSIEVQP